MKRDIFVLLLVLTLFSIGFINTFNNIFTASLIDVVNEDILEDNDSFEDDNNFENNESVLILNVDNNSVKFLMKGLDKNSDIVIYYGDEYLKLFNKEGDVCINISNLLSGKSYDYKVIVNDDMIDSGNFKINYRQ